MARLKNKNSQKTFIQNQLYFYIILQSQTKNIVFILFIGGIVGMSGLASNAHAAGEGQRCQGALSVQANQDADGCDGALVCMGYDVFGKSGAGVCRALSPLGSPCTVYRNKFQDQCQTGTYCIGGLPGSAGTCQKPPKGGKEGNVCTHALDAYDPTGHADGCEGALACIGSPQGSTNGKCQSLRPIGETCTVYAHSDWDACEMGSACQGAGGTGSKGICQAVKGP